MTHLLGCVASPGKSLPGIERGGSTTGESPPPPDEPQSKPGQMRKGQSQPDVFAAAFLILEAWFWGDHFIGAFSVLFPIVMIYKTKYRVLIVTQMGVGSPRKFRHRDLAYAKFPADGSPLAADGQAEWG